MTTPSRARVAAEKVRLELIKKRFAPGSANALQVKGQIHVLNDNLGPDEIQTLALNGDMESSMLSALAWLTGEIKNRPSDDWKLTSEDIHNRTKAILVEQLGVRDDQIASGVNFVEDLGCDSLDLIESVMAFEEEFDIEITDDEAEKLLTVSDLERLLIAKLP